MKRNLPLLSFVLLLLLMGMVATATAQTLAPSYDEYEVIDVQEFELWTGSGRSAAHLSPDGTRFLHVSGTDFCLYELSDEGVWTESDCFDGQTRGVILDDPEEIVWSPDSRWLALPTFQDAFMFFRDPDIRVYAVETGETMVLTEDDSEGSPLDADFNGLYDITPKWMDADTLMFVRYLPEFPENEGLPFGAPRLMQIDVPDGEPQEVATLPSTMPLSVYAYDVSGDGTQIVYSVDHRDSEAGQGIWLMTLVDPTAPESLLPLETRSGMPLSMKFSATGEYLTLMLAAYTSRGESSVKVLDIANEAMLDIDPDRTVVGAAWSPEGDALAYLVRNPSEVEANGLYITSQPGVPGRLVLEGDYFTPTCCGRMPLVWGANDTILIGRGADAGVLLVKVGVE